jgi:hypothetical protein
MRTKFYSEIRQFYIIFYSDLVDKCEEKERMKDSDKEIMDELCMKSTEILNMRTSNPTCISGM